MDKESESKREFIARSLALCTRTHVCAACILKGSKPEKKPDANRAKVNKKKPDANNDLLE